MPGSPCLCEVSLGSLKTMWMPWSTRSQGWRGRGGAEWRSEAAGGATRGGRAVTWKPFGSNLKRCEGLALPLPGSPGRVTMRVAESARRPSGRYGFTLLGSGGRGPFGRCSSTTQRLQKNSSLVCLRSCPGTKWTFVTSWTAAGSMGWALRISRTRGVHRRGCRSRSHRKGAQRFPLPGKRRSCVRGRQRSCRRVGGAARWRRRRGCFRDRVRQLCLAERPLQVLRESQLLGSTSGRCPRAAGEAAPWTELPVCKLAEAVVDRCNPAVLLKVLPAGLQGRLASPVCVAASCRRGWPRSSDCCVWRRTFCCLCWRRCR